MSMIAQPLAVDYEAARRSRDRQRLLAGIHLVNGDKHGADAKGTQRKGTPQHVTEAMLLDRALASAAKDLALAPPRLSIEEPVDSCDNDSRVLGGAVGNGVGHGQFVTQLGGAASPRPGSSAQRTDRAGWRLSAAMRLRRVLPDLASALAGCWPLFWKGATRWLSRRRSRPRRCA